MTFGEKLKHLRNARGWTMQHLADLMNDENQTKIGRGRLSQWEHGVNDPSFSAVIQLAEIFRVSVDYFMPNSGDDVNQYLLDNDFNQINNKYIQLVPRRRAIVDDCINKQFDEQNKK